MAAPALSEHFGPYRIVKQLGKGGMGTVYLARDTRLNREVALKVCHVANNDQAHERFRREALAAAALRHPNLCPVYECDAVGEVHYLAMAYIKGPNLGAWLQERGRPTQPQAALLVRKLALAMAEAHRQGVIHRDLKPGNIAMDRGEPIILDFGLARQAGVGDSPLTRTGVVLGTPAYMPPEQVTGDVKAMGPGCDIYSLGAILYEILTGHLPFEGPVTGVLAQVLYSEPIPPRTLSPDLDPRLEAICLKALAKKPADRFPEMMAFATALMDYLQAATAAPAPAGEPKTEPRGNRTRPARATAPREATVQEPVASLTLPAAASASRSRPRRSRSSARFRTWVVALALALALAGGLALSFRGGTSRRDPANRAATPVTARNNTLSAQSAGAHPGDGAAQRGRPDGRPGPAPDARAPASSTLPASGPELLVNPGAEELPVGRKSLPGWEVVSGSYSSRRNGAGAAHEGIAYFYAGKTKRSECQQIVDVSRYAVAIDAGRQSFAFEAYTHSFDQGRGMTDFARCFVEYLAADRQTVLTSYDSGRQAHKDGWKLLRDIRHAPPGTRAIRVRLVSVRRSGIQNNGCFDALSLKPVAETAPK